MIMIKISMQFYMKHGAFWETKPSQVTSEMTEITPKRDCFQKLLNHNAKWGKLHT